jgi:hypothetical protein
MRGRIEIARLDLTDSSLNLVHRDGGRWNLEALLERASSSPLAPTGKTKSEPRQAFPYIQATSARINFKFGQEKKPYALINADFSLWQDSENSWGVRLKAQPFRTDLSLSDTGLLRVNGTWQRAESLRETPLQFALEWDRPQLGQLTKFLTGTDKGWRGAVLLDATLAGTPAKLQITSDASIRDFRRYDIVSGDPVGLAAHCDGQYSSVDRTVHQISCRAPVRSGAIALSGEVGLPGSHVYDLVLTAYNLPVSAAAALAQRAKKNLPEDLVAAGTVDGSFSMRQNSGSAAPEFEGQGEIANLRLVSDGDKSDFAVAGVPFRMTSLAPGAGRHVNALPSEPRLEFGPVTLTTGKAVNAKGWMSGTSYGISLTGETEIGRTLRAAHLLGIPALTTAAEGMANVNLQIKGNWGDWSANNPSSFFQPQVTGTAKLRSVHVLIRGTSHPVEISSADLQFSADAVKVSRITVNAARTSWTGSLELPRGCGTPSACLIHFNLSGDDTRLSDLRQWVQPDPGVKPWYSVLTPATKNAPSFFGSLRATGRLTANRLLVKNLVATGVSANVSLDAGKIKISDLGGELLCGTHWGDWQADFTHRIPIYSGSGTLTGVRVDCADGGGGDSQATGVAEGKYQITASGLSAEDFWRSADATVQFVVRDGSLPNFSLANDGDPFNISRFEGHAHLHESMLEIKDADLDSPEGAFHVSGTASLSRELDFKLTPVLADNSTASTPTPPSYTVTGTLSQPQVAVVAGSETQARLKP